MSPEAILEILAERFAGRVQPAGLDTTHPHALVEASVWREVALFLRDDERLGFEWLRCISSVDLPDDGKVAAVYDLHAMDRPADFSPESLAASDPLAGTPWTQRHAFAAKVLADRDDPRIPSVADVWPAANWHEREAYDLMGIVFEGHSNLTRILCPDDWQGHALRKDYKMPTEYEGIADPAGAAQSETESETEES